MAWEKGRYYVRKVRRDGKVSGVHIGGGLIGEMAAAADRLRRVERERVASSRRRTLETLDRAAALNAEIGAWGRLLGEAAMLAAGYRLRRHEWRRTMQAREAILSLRPPVPLSASPATSGADAPDTAAAAKAADLKRMMRDVLGDEPDISALPAGEQELRELVQQAHKGDTSVLPQVRALLKTVPDEAIRLFRGDLGENVVRTVLNRCIPNPAMREATAADLRRFRAELAGDSTDALELMLVETVVRCRLEAQLADMTVAAVGEAGQSRGLLRRRDAAHRRLLSASRTLATVRKQALPVLRLHLPAAKTAAAG